jgi:hypothetical protein
VVYLCVPKVGTQVITLVPELQGHYLMHVPSIEIKFRQVLPLEAEFSLVATSLNNFNFAKAGVWFEKRMPLSFVLKAYADHVTIQTPARTFDLSLSFP